MFHGNAGAVVRSLRALICLVAAAGVVGPAIASTTVPAGTIATDTTWTLAGSPYLLQGNLTIQGTDGGDGVTTLTIEPGVEVRLQGAGNSQLLVGGTSVSSPGALVADGNAAGGPAAIVFTGDSVTPASGDWEQIYFRAGADASSVLRNVVVEYAGRSNQAAVWMQQTAGVTIVLDEITVQQSAYRGIQFGRGDVALSDCTVTNNPNEDDLYFSNAVMAGSVTNCVLESIFYAGVSPSIDWSGNTFDNWGDRTSVAAPNDVGEIAGGNTFTNAAPGAVLEVLGGTVAQDAAWTPAPGPYVVLGNLTIQGPNGSSLATLTLEPGVEMRFRGAGNSQLLVGGTSLTGPGALIADGNAAGGPAAIVFTGDSVTPAPGDWEQIYFRAGADASSVLRNVVVEYAGRGNQAAVWMQQTAGVTIVLDEITVQQSAYRGIQFGRGDVALSDCTVTNNPNEDDLYFSNAVMAGSVTNCVLESIFYAGVSPSIDWSGNTFDNWGDRTSVAAPNDVGEIAGGNTFTNAAPGAVLEVLGGTVATDAAWTTAPGPYVVLGNLTIQGPDGSSLATLTLEPGVEMRFRGAGNSQLLVGGTSVSSPGALVADGNAAGGPAAIVFTGDSVTPAPGDWEQIYFRAGADASSVLRNVVVEYAGRGNQAAVWMQQTAGVTIVLDEITVQQSAYRGIQFGRGDVALSDCTVTNNPNEDDLYFSNAVMAGSVTNCVLESIFYAGVSPSIDWSGNTFDNWGDRTSVAAPNDVGEIAGGNTFTNAAPGAVLEVLGGTVATDAAWTTAPGPYVVLGNLTIQGPDGSSLATLTLEPGVEMRFRGAGNSQLLVGGTSVSSPGALVADGNAAGGPAAIVFTSDSVTPAPGDWEQIYFRAGADASSVLRNVVVEYAGRGNQAAVSMQQTAGVAIVLDEITVQQSAYRGIQLSRGDVALSDCTVTNNPNEDDLYFSDAVMAGSVTNCVLESIFYAGVSPSISWSGNTFDNWGGRTSRVRTRDAGEICTGNTFNPLPGAVMELISETLIDDTTWTADPGPLVVVSGNLTIQGTDGPDGMTTLTLNPGTTIRMPLNTWFYIGGTSGNPGELLANGSLGGGAFETINFNTSEGVPNVGDWNGVHVRATGRAALQEVQIQNVDTALTVDGNLGLFDRVSINRANVGVDLLSSALLDGSLNRLLVKNTGIALRTSGVAPVVRDSNLIGSTFGVENLTPGTHCVDATMNWWGATDGPSGTLIPIGCETVDPTGAGSVITDGVLYGSFLGVPPDDGDSVACDDGDGFPDPCSGGTTIDCDDNCCTVANDSQSDLDGDGTGDACDSNPVLRVSNDPVDGADFDIVQDAADATFQSGSRIEIFPGLRPYDESVRLDRDQVYSFVGLKNVNDDPVIVDGGAGAAFRVINKVGVVPTSFRNLTFRGNQGVRASVDTDLQDVVFDANTQEALELDAGSHTLARATIDMCGVGAHVASGAALDASRTVMLGLTDAGLIVDGSATLVNVVIGDGNGADGVRMGATGVFDGRYLTIANNTNVGIDNTQSGTITLDRSIVYGNALDDLVSVDCNGISWSNTGDLTCTTVNDNLSADPLLDALLRPQAGSPCLDYGPPADTYDGTPPTDTVGGPRLLDHDGDGQALNDCGAYEIADPSITPGAVQNVLWELDFRMIWDIEPSAVQYHIYRDSLANLSFQSYGVCRDDLDTGGLGDTQLDDFEEPAPGSAFFYLVTAEDGSGNEGTLGLGTSAERSNFAACP